MDTLAYHCVPLDCAHPETSQLSFHGTNCIIQFSLLHRFRLLIELEFECPLRICPPDFKDSILRNRSQKGIMTAGLYFPREIKKSYCQQLVRSENYHLRTLS